MAVATAATAGLAMLASGAPPASAAVHAQPAVAQVLPSVQLGELVGALTELQAGSSPVSAAAASVGVRSYRYGSSKYQQLDVYTPAKYVGKTGKKLGTVVMVHGGGWTQGDKDQFTRQARQFANKGYVAVSMNYRLASVAPWPAQRDDALSALRYLRNRASSLNVDANRIVMIGSSAGGHIAASAATWGAGKKRVKGLVTLSGPLDPRKVAEDPYGLRWPVINSLLRCLPILCPSAYDKAAPINYLTPGDAPALVFHSRNEPIDSSSATEFVRRANAVGSSARMAWVSGSQHGLAYWDRIWPTVRDFVQTRIGPA